MARWRPPEAEPETARGPLQDPWEERKGAVMATEPSRPKSDTCLTPREPRAHPRQARRRSPADDGGETTAGDHDLGLRRGGGDACRPRVSVWRGCRREPGGAACASGTTGSHTQIAHIARACARAGHRPKPRGHPCASFTHYATWAGITPGSER